MWRGCPPTRAPSTVPAPPRRRALLLLTRCHPHLDDSGSASACEPYREVIVAALGQGRNAMAIYQDPRGRPPLHRRLRQRQTLHAPAASRQPRGGACPDPDRPGRGTRFTERPTALRLRATPRDQGSLGSIGTTAEKVDDPRQLAHNRRLDLGLLQHERFPGRLPRLRRRCCDPPQALLQPALPRRSALRAPRRNSYNSFLAKIGPLSNPSGRVLRRCPLTNGGSRRTSAVKKILCTAR